MLLLITSAKTMTMANDELWKAWWWWLSRHGEGQWGEWVRLKRMILPHGKTLWLDESTLCIPLTHQQRWQASATGCGSAAGVYVTHTHNSTPSPNCATEGTATGSCCTSAFSPWWYDGDASLYCHTYNTPLSLPFSYHLSGVLHSRSNISSTHCTLMSHWIIG